MRQDLPVAGPSAVTVSLVTGRLGGACGTEARRRWILAPVVRRGRSADPRLEKELPDPVDFHEWVVELGGRKRQKGVMGSDAPTDGEEPTTRATDGELENISFVVLEAVSMAATSSARILSVYPEVCRVSTEFTGNLPGRAAVVTPKHHNSYFWRDTAENIDLFPPNMKHFSIWVLMDEVLVEMAPFSRCCCTDQPGGPQRRWLLCHPTNWKPSSQEI